MGSTGRSTTSWATAGASAMGPTSPSIPPVNANQPDVADQVPNAQNTPVATDAALAFSQLDDASMAALINASKQAVLPNQLADRQNITQSVVFQAGINEKPQVLDANAFDQFVRDNNLQNRILARSINPAQYVNQSGRNVRLTPQDISDMLKYSRVNYIGGKQGGSAYGFGTYFAVRNTVGQSTGYGGTTLNAVLNPATARMIDESSLYARARSWATSHPQTARALGSINATNQSVYALAMGYNVVTSGPSSIANMRYDDYIVVIDRRALVYRK